MTCRLFGAKPLSEPMLTCYQLDPSAQFNEILVKIPRFPWKKIHFKMPYAKWWPFCLFLLRVKTLPCSARHSHEHIDRRPPCWDSHHAGLGWSRVFRSHRAEPQGWFCEMEPRHTSQMGYRSPTPQRPPWPPIKQPHIAWSETWFLSKKGERGKLSSQQLLWQPTECLPLRPVSSLKYISLWG